MRTDNVIKNGIWGSVYQVANIILGFIGRTVFIYFLNSEYLGISGLFSNVLSILSLSELGFSSAIAFHLYGCLAKDDKAKIAAIMNFYKNVYRIIGFVVLALGIAVLPFLGFIIKESNFDLSYIRLVYVIYLLQTVTSYFYSYKFTLAIADQKNYLMTNVDIIFRLVTTAVNIAVLILFKNFIIYLLSNIASGILCNICKAYRVSKYYPYIKGNEQLGDGEKKKILGDVKNIFAGKVSTVIVTSTDNILISAMVALSVVGVYSNYAMLIGYIQAFLTQFTTATQASIGNMVATESKEHSYDIMKKLTVIIYLILSFCCVSFFVLLNPFITLWIGEGFLLSMSVVFWCIFSFYIQIVKAPVWYSLGAVGYFKEDRNISIIGAVSNLFVSIVCAYFLGLSGIFIGTVVSQLIQWILKVRLFTKKYLNIKMKEYLGLSIMLLGATFIVMGATYAICYCISLDNAYIEFLIKAFCCLLIPNGLNWLLFRKTEAFAYLMSIVRKLLRKVFSKRKKVEGRL